MTCAVCEADTPEGIHLCHGCTERLEYDLAETGAVWEELQTTIARQDKGAPGVGGGHGGSRPPVNLDAMDKGQTLRVILTGWTQLLPGLHPVSTDPDKVAAWLLGQAGVIRRMDWAGDLCRELRESLTACRRATDRAERCVFAGTCPTVEEGQACLTPIYVREGRPEARCPTCGATWDVSEWRGRALAAAKMVHGTPAELSRMLSDPVTGETLQPGTIRQWIRRGTLTPIGMVDGRPVYQVRKVGNLWARGKASRYTRKQTAA